MSILNSALWCPDYIFESSGIACGDNIILYVVLNEDKIVFTFKCDSCIPSKKMAELLESKLSGCNKNDIIAKIERIEKRDYEHDELWIEDIIKNRKMCIESPLNLLKKVFEVNSTCTINSESPLLACDACVSQRRINWEKTTNNENNKIAFKEYLNVKELYFENSLQKLGLFELTDNQQNMFREELAFVSNIKMKSIKKLRLAVPFLNNSIKYNLPLDKKIIELANRQIISMKIADDEINSIINFINENALKINLVKGSTVDKYYPSNLYRTHMDYDFLADSINDAFILINRLINIYQFKITIDGGVPFSFKVVKDAEHEEIITGHIHLEKILQNSFQCIVDINMNGFPLGRSSIIKCEHSDLMIEDQFCITLAHIFKHEHVFIKDVNDLYYMFNNPMLNMDVLRKKIRKYKMTNLFSVVCLFFRNYNLFTNIKISHNLINRTMINKGWPFSRKSNLYIKIFDLLISLINEFGLYKGLKECYGQLTNSISKHIKTNKYNTLCNYFNTRTYLIPIVFFKKIIIIPNEAPFIYIDNMPMVKYKDIIITTIGLFLIQAEKYNRNEVKNEIKDILSFLKINTSDCNFYFTMQARQELWLY